MIRVEVARIVSLLCLLSELEARMDTYVPMYSSTSRGQEDIALLTCNSTDMDAYEGQKHYLNPEEHPCCRIRNAST